MSALTFKLKNEPPFRLNVSGLIPSRLAGLGARDIARLSLAGGRAILSVGDIFDVAGSDANDIRFLGDCSKLDFIGAKLDGGRILVEGNAGVAAGSGMEDGLMTVAGNAGAYAGAGLKGGVLKIEGNVGDCAGGALPGETNGMRGGFLLVRGNAGARAGDRMRRGVAVIEGDAGDYAGSRIIAGTLVILGKVGALPGYLMRRGSILVRDIADPGPTFLDAGLQEFVWLRILARHLAAQGVRNAQELGSSARRYSGDMATLGKGEILSLAG